MTMTQPMIDSGLTARAFVGLSEPLSSRHPELAIKPIASLGPRQMALTSIRQVSIKATSAGALFHFDTRPAVSSEELWPV